MTAYTRLMNSVCKFNKPVSCFEADTEWYSPQCDARQSLTTLHMSA